MVLSAGWRHRRRQATASSNICPQSPRPPVAGDQLAGPLGEWGQVTKFNDDQQLGLGGPGVSVWRACRPGPSVVDH